jgi:hypothetical protein
MKKKKNFVRRLVVTKLGGEIAPYPVENHNCGINSPERETTETSDDLHGKSERMEAGSDKESYATSTIQVVSTNTFVDLKILHLLILHSFLKEQGDFLYSGQFL